MVKYMAYTFTTHGKEFQSDAHDTREDAAKQLFDVHPKLKSVPTAEAVCERGTWLTYGRNIQTIRR